MNIPKAIFAGFIATLVLSVLMIFKAMMGLMPDLNVIKMLAHMMHAAPVMGWVAHFVVGAIIWGIAFALLFNKLPSQAPWLKGIIFAIGAWVLMMIVVMPMAGAGLFGLHLGIMAPVMTLVLHIIFGAVLGGVYGRPAG